MSIHLSIDRLVNPLMYHLIDFFMYVDPILCPSKHVLINALIDTRVYLQKRNVVYITKILLNTQVFSQLQSIAIACYTLTVSDMLFIANKQAFIFEINLCLLS